MDTNDFAMERLSRSGTAGAAGSARAEVGVAACAVRLPKGAVFGRQLAELRRGVGSRAVGVTESNDRSASGGVAALREPEPRPQTGMILPREVSVQRGDTLTSLVWAQWRAGGGAAEDLSPSDAHRWALKVARENGLSNPDLILVGQRVVVGSPPIDGVRAPDRSTVVTPLAKPVIAGPTASLGRLDSVMAASRLDNPLLAQTLDRAVDLGYVPASDRAAVSERIEGLGVKFGFKPDDFAKAVLMESDGLNPRASNGRCHGIIQFCNGPNRGAASAGYGQRPQEILKLSVLQQLDLVEHYFDDTKLKEFRGLDGRVRLDDLYLTILTPAARQERSLSAPLPIAGPQAVDLHVRRERHAPITRSSILAGLHVNAKARLGQFMVAGLSTR